MERPNHAKVESYSTSYWQQVGKVIWNIGLSCSTGTYKVKIGTATSSAIPYKPPVSQSSWMSCIVGFYKVCMASKRLVHIIMWGRILF